MSEEIISTDIVPKHPEECLSASEQEAAHQRERAELQKLLSASNERANLLEERFISAIAERDAANARIESVVFRYKEMFGEDELYVRFQTKTKQIEAELLKNSSFQ